jgi:hypothetical protein
VRARSPIPNPARRQTTLSHRDTEPPLRRAQDSRTDPWRERLPHRYSNITEELTAGAAGSARESASGILFSTSQAHLLYPAQSRIPLGEDSSGSAGLGTAVDVVRLHTFRPLADYAEVIHSSSTHGLTHCCASRGRGRIYKEGMQLTQCPPSPPGLNCRAAPTTRVSSGIDAAGMY